MPECDRGVLCDASSFQVLLADDHYDGASTGFALDVADRWHWFGLLDWDGHTDRRVFGCALVDELAAGLEVVLAARMRDSPRPGAPRGWFNLRETDAAGGNDASADLLCRAAEAAARPVSVVVAERLLGPVELWRAETQFQVAGFDLDDYPRDCSAGRDGVDWFDRLGLAR